MSYLDKHFNPATEFWKAFYIQNKCPSCGYCLNGGIYRWQLLEGPVDVKCHKCKNTWSHAIPVGSSMAREEIMQLLETEKRFYALRDELRSVINILHGDEDK